MVEKERSKRPRTENASVYVERVPAFIAEKAPLVEEDPTPFTVGWGLRNRDTTVCDSRAAAEWSRGVITPRDRAHIVESSDDLQIEVLGAEATTSVSFSQYFIYLMSYLYSIFIYFIFMIICSADEHLLANRNSQSQNGASREDHR